jgi:hypothetical protein
VENPAEAEKTADAVPTSEPEGSAGSPAGSAEAPDGSAAPATDPSVQPTSAPSAEVDGEVSASLPGHRAHITVTSTASGIVTLSGVEVGPANQRLEVLCGNAFLRLATKNETTGALTFVSAGQPVAIPCRKHTEINEPAL